MTKCYKNAAKRSFFLLLFVPILLVGCSQDETINLPQSKSTIMESEKTNGKIYPPENEIDFEEHCLFLPEEIYSTTAEENGLSGTVYRVEGIVEEYDSTSGFTTIAINIPENKNIIIIDPVSLTQYSQTTNEVEVDFEQMRTYYPLPEVGEKVIIYAEYQGMSGVYECPAFLYASEDYLTSTLLLCAKSTTQEDKAAQEDVPVTEAKGTEGNPYGEGMYKVGLDVPAGEYVFLQCDSYSAYVCASSDSNQDDIIENAIFENSFFMTVEDGQYLEAKNCEFFQAEGYTLVKSQDGVVQEGMYRVGIDIRAGEYQVEALQEKRGYWCIYNSSTVPQEIESNKVFENSTYVTVADGQYIFLNGCRATKID